MTLPGGPRWPEAHIREVIEVEFNRGQGIVGDPVRRVFAYFDRNGVLLAERDTLNPDFAFDVPAPSEPTFDANGVPSYLRSSNVR